MNEGKYHFLCDSLKKGFQLLKDVRISFYPKDEKEVVKIIKNWALMLVQDCDWNDVQDYQRIIKAFAYLAKNDENFPSLARFIKVLPERAPPELPLLLPEPEASPESINENINKIRAILKNNPVCTKIKLGASVEQNTAIARAAIEANQTKQDADYKKSQNQLFTQLSRGKQS